MSTLTVNATTIGRASEYERPLVVGGVTGPEQLEAASRATTAVDVRAALLKRTGECAP